MNNLDIEKLKSYINDLEEQITPLTKKGNSKQPEQAGAFTEATNCAYRPVETPIPHPEVIEQPKQAKSKKQYSVTDKKLMALELAREKKNQNHEKRVKEKKLESAKLLLAEEISKPKEPLKPKPTKKVIEVESDSEPEIIYVKKPKKNKKIIVEESSDSESEASDHEPKKSKQFGKSHKNRKSVIKVHSNPAPQPKANPIPYNNYFC